MSATRALPRRALTSRCGVLAVVSVFVCACGRTPSRAPTNLPHGRDSRVVAATEFRLRDDTFDLLARPIAASRDRGGHLVIADESQKNIKIYDQAGVRLATLGRAGEGDGEFVQLTGAETLGDSVVAYDFYQKRLTVFRADGGRPVSSRLVPSEPFTIATVDDSLLLLIRHPGQRGPLLALGRLNGSVVAEFFEPNAFFSDPRLRYLSAVFADAHDGLVFAGVFGDTTLYVYDYAGRLRTAVAIPARPPLPALDVLLRAKGGQVRGEDSAWFHDRAAVLLRVVALDSGSAALQIARYDARRGTDLISTGSDVIIVRPLATGVGASPRYLRVTGALIGRDRDGALLVISGVNRMGRELVLHRIAAP